MITPRNNYSSVYTSKILRKLPSMFIYICIFLKYPQASSSAGAQRDIYDFTFIPFRKNQPKYITTVG